ncbi:DEAD/DEAH box helicase [Leptospira adleri]|uniref:DEAD-box ATP-dependent RNA helicase RhpA n=1 Tax=Leptospira adleri TaxID=2023186 RepID=A0A2M9YK90_9LEPT|nr:DEAD/DEAH box helicase [Leptospira adleri]PJZ51958.1 DEAD/DEAH box helicase [Leptospira adleri]PJZ60409.1 DEAD/DEAH box helicase [Leptospira adleri]
MHNSIENFSNLPLAPPIQQSIQDVGYSKPTPIQMQAIPPLLEGKDLLGCAQTGTGKTAAFALPILHRLFTNQRKAAPKQTRVLVLTPTRELAIQVHDSFKVYGQHLKLKSAVIFGGVGQSPQVKSLSSGVDVLVATPGRLVDLIDQRFLSLSELEVFVLDEADRMLDMGFIHSIRKIIALLPKKRHNLFFSATMPPDIEKLAGTMLVNPVRIEVTPVSSTVESIQQSVMFVDSDKKKELLKHLFKNPELKRVIVFTKTKHGANRVSELLSKSGISVDVIHGNKSQSARQRALEDFRVGKIRALIATDIAARGIDIDEISHVINYEIPNIPESYVHRIGRTARAGTEGVAISLCDMEERAFVRDIERVIGRKIPVNQQQPFHSENVMHFTGRIKPKSNSGGRPPQKFHSSQNRKSKNPPSKQRSFR